MKRLTELVDSALNKFVTSLDEEIKENVKFLCVYGSLNPEHDIDIAMVVSDNVSDFWKEQIKNYNCRWWDIPEFKQGGDVSVSLQNDFELRLDFLDVEVTEIIQGYVNPNAEYFRMLPELKQGYVQSLKEKIKNPKISNKTILYARARGLQFYDRSKTSLNSFLEETRENFFLSGILGMDKQFVKEYGEKILSNDIGFVHRIPNRSMEYLGYAFTNFISAEHYSNSNELLRVRDVLQCPKTESEHLFQGFFTTKKEVERGEERFDLGWMTRSLKNLEGVVLK